MINNSFFYKMSFSNNCLLCLKHSDDLFKIFGSRGIQLNTGTILKEHFWFEVSESDEKSICEECWWTVQNFHEFYHSVKLNHQHQSISEVESISIDANKHNKIVDVLDTIKDEPNIDIENDIDECSPDIPDTVHTLDVNKSSTESKSIRSVIIDANKHNKIVDLLDTIKDELHIDTEIDIGECSSDIPDTVHTLDVNKSSTESKSIRSVIIDANKHNKIVDVLDTIKDEPNIDIENDIDECSPDIPDTVHTLDVNKSSTESKSIKSIIIDANKHNKRVDLLGTSKHEPNIDIENGIEDGSSDIPDAKESDKESELNHATDLPTIIRRKRPKTSVSPSTKTIAKICKTDCHTAILSTYFDMSCNLCGDALLSFREMRSHYKCVHNVNNGYLVCCNQKFCRLQHMLQHCQWHTNPNIFKCDDCSKTFNAKYKLRNHMDICRVADNEKKFRCNFCEMKFSRQFHLNTHIRSRHSSQSSVAAHKKTTKKRIFIKRAHQDVHSHICEICAKPFCSKNSYEMHYMQKHTDHDTNTVQKVQCDICGNWLKNKTTLRRHFHGHRNKTETCRICGRVSSGYQSLQAHIRNTHREASLECVICGKMFKKQCVLKEHMAIHAGITDLYKCTFCEKTFRSNANMYAHRKRAHPDELEQKKASLKLNQLS